MISDTLHDAVAEIDAYLLGDGPYSLERDWLDAVDDEPEAPRPADEDMCGGRNTMTRAATGDLAGYAD
jgi:hypothetical protein